MRPPHNIFDCNSNYNRITSRHSKLGGWGGVWGDMNEGQALEYLKNDTEARCQSLRPRGKRYDSDMYRIMKNLPLKWADFSRK